MDIETLQDGAEIERRRIAAGMGRTALGRAVNLHRTYIRLIEIEHRSVLLPTLNRIAGALPDCTPDDLLKTREPARNAA